jgi:AcrR family transcriptional regulator
MGRPPRISKDQILEAARGAFAERGFDATTLADIAGSLGVTPAALLRHFPSKQELFASAATQIPIPPPLIELAFTHPTEDPRVVLRRFAEQMVPFIQSVIGSAIAMQMHMRSRQATLVLPFDPTADETPPKRGLRVVAEYFQAAMDAGTIRDGDPRSLALLFVGHLQSYVLLHTVLNVKPVYPLDRFLDALIDLWVGGAIVTGVPHAETNRRGPRSSRRRRGSAAVRAKGKGTKASRPGRHAGGEDGERRLAGRRPRGPRSRR